MKKALFLLLAGLGAAGAALAGPPPAANVNFASARGVPFAVVLDGQPLTGRGLARQVHAEQLAPGMHYADFSVPTPYGGAVRLRSRVWLEPGLETTFVLLARPGQPLDLRQAGTVALYGGYCRGNYGGRYDDGRERDYDDHDQDCDDHDRRGYGQPSSFDTRGYGGTYPYSASPYGQRPNRPDPAYNQGQGDGYNQNHNAGAGYNQPANGGPGAGYYNDTNGSYQVMAAPDVDGLIQALSRCSFEDERLQMARQALSQTSIRAEDLGRLLSGFHFDDSRVNFAKFAYPHVADRQNFYRVYPSFDFSAHAREVQDAVAQMND